MMQDLTQMTTTELKQYLSQNRNDSDAFHAGLQVMMSRRNPANVHPPLSSMADPEATFSALLKEHLDRSGQ
jgi:hypothetical protein